jgi:cytochrome P450
VKIVVDSNRCPDRTDNMHLGFGRGIHYCAGTPLARIEGNIALGELARRLVAPRLVEDPPPYRANAALRGPRHLMVAYDRLDDVPTLGDSLSGPCGRCSAR